MCQPICNACPERALLKGGLIEKVIEFECLANF